MLIASIRNFLLRGIRDVRRRAAERKRRRMERKQRLAIIIQEERRILEEQKRIDAEAHQQLLSHHSGSSITWHGTTMAGKNLAAAAKALGSQTSSKIRYNQDKENVTASLSSFTLSTKPLQKRNSESALKNLFGIDVHNRNTINDHGGSSHNQQTNTSITLTGTSLPLSGAARASSPLPGLEFPPLPIPDSHPPQLLVSQTYYRTRSFGNLESLNSKPTMPVKSIIANPTISMNQLRPNSRPNTPMRGTTTNGTSGLIGGPSGSGGGGSSAGSLANFAEYDFGFPVIRTDTVDSTLEAALELGYSVDNLATESEDDGGRMETKVDRKKGAAEAALKELGTAKQRATALFQRSGSTKGRGDKRGTVLTRNPTVGSKWGGIFSSRADEDLLNFDRRGSTAEILDVGSGFSSAEEDFDVGYHYFQSEISLQPLRKVAVAEKEKNGSGVTLSMGLNNNQENYNNDDEDDGDEHEGQEENSNVDNSSKKKGTKNGNQQKKWWRRMKLLVRIHAFIDSNSDTLAVAVAVFSTLFGASAFLCLTEGDWSYIDAVYFTYSLITTTGYGDIYPETGWGRTIVIIMIFLELGLWAYAVSTIVARIQAARVGAVARRIHDEKVARRESNIEPKTVNGISIFTKSSEIGEFGDESADLEAFLASNQEEEIEEKDRQQEQEKQHQLSFSSVLFEHSRNRSISENEVKEDEEDEITTRTIAKASKQFNNDDDDNDDGKKYGISTMTRSFSDVDPVTRAVIDLIQNRDAGSNDAHQNMKLLTHILNFRPTDQQFFDTSDFEFQDDDAAEPKKQRNTDSTKAPLLDAQDNIIDEKIVELLKGYGNDNLAVAALTDRAEHQKELDDILNIRDQLDDIIESGKKVTPTTSDTIAQDIHDATAFVVEEIGEIQTEFAEALSKDDDSHINEVIQRCEGLKSTCTTSFSAIANILQNEDFDNGVAEVFENINLSLAAFQEIISSRNRSGNDESKIRVASNIVEIESGGISDTDSACDGVISTQGSSNHRTTSHLMMNPADFMEKISGMDYAYAQTRDIEETNFKNGDNDAKYKISDKATKATVTDNPVISIVEYESRISEMAKMMDMATSGLNVESKRQSEIVSSLKTLQSKTANEQKSRRQQLNEYEHQHEKLMFMKDKLGALRDVASKQPGGLRGIDRLKRMQAIEQEWVDFKTREDKEEGGNDAGFLQLPHSDHLQNLIEERRDSSLEKVAALVQYQHDLQGQEDEVYRLRQQLDELRRAKAILDEKKNLLATVLETHGNFEQTSQEGNEAGVKRISDLMNFFGLNSNAQVDEIKENDVPMSEDGQEEEDVKLSELEEKLEIIRKQQDDMKSLSSFTEQSRTNTLKKHTQFKQEAEVKSDAENNSSIEIDVEQLLAKLLENSVKEKVEEHFKSTKENSLRTPFEAQSIAAQSIANWNGTKQMKGIPGVIKSKDSESRSNGKKTFQSKKSSQKSNSYSAETKITGNPFELQESRLNERLQDVWNGNMTGYEDIEVETFGDLCCKSNSCVNKKNRSGRYDCEFDDELSAITPSQKSPIKPLIANLTSSQTSGLDSINEIQIRETSSKIEEGIAQITEQMVQIKQTDVDFSKPEQIRSFTELFSSLSNQLNQFLEARETISQFKFNCKKPEEISYTKSEISPLKREATQYESNLNFLKSKSQHAKNILENPVTVAEAFNELDKLIYSRGNPIESVENDTGNDPVENDDEIGDWERTLDAKMDKRAVSGDNGKKSYAWVEAAEVDEIEVEHLKRANDIVEMRLKESVDAMTRQPSETTVGHRFERHTKE
ncbi:hypothetical protein HK100_010183 [Physocladia obscura]|uniref:Potassium channel domain-containing protein n=1 Tax=Physocladia obscura TaxID=109957 RepID=A0AAD5XDX1_9FUNG|nr:hypothetical protein HK100_010183 [Physocladia obscura]